MNAERVKKQILKAISTNPTTITINQLIKNIKDGYLEERDDKKDLTVLIYKENSKSDIKVSSGTMGISYSSKQYSMIADYTADLEVNPKQSIEFDCKEGHMKIKYVYPIVIKDVVCGYECVLERID